MKIKHIKHFPTGIPGVEAELIYLVNFTETPEGIKIGTVFVRVAILEEQTDWQKVDKISEQLSTDFIHEAERQIRREKKRQNKTA